MTSRGFNARAAFEAFFKCENLQTGGAFKIRGACQFYRAAFRGPTGARRGRVFLREPRAGRGDRRARGRGAKATLVMPLDAPRSKVEATRAQGATIVTYDRFQGRPDGASGKRIAEETGATLVPPFDHPWIIAGQGTAALELLEEVPDLDALVVPSAAAG